MRINIIRKSIFTNRLSGLKQDYTYRPHLGLNMATPMQKLESFRMDKLIKWNYYIVKNGEKEYV